jgi:hypothetical protein
VALGFLAAGSTRALGHPSESHQLRAHRRRLITMRDSPNGKRYGQRDARGAS